MSRTIEQRTNFDGFPKAGELIEMTGLEDIDASQRAISNLLYQHAHDSGRIADNRHRIGRAVRVYFESVVEAFMRVPRLDQLVPLQKDLAPLRRRQHRQPIHRLRVVGGHRR